MLVKQTPSDEGFKEGDVCTIETPELDELWRAEWARPIVTCILVEMVRSYMTGNYWLALLGDGTVTVFNETLLEKVVNQ